MLTKTFNIFSSSAGQSSILKILFANSIRETVSYLQQNFLWINKLFVNLENNYKKICLTIDYFGINPNGSGRFRTEADNTEAQAGYFNINKNDKLFISKWIRNNFLKETIIKFQIERVQCRRKNSETLDVSVKLKDLIQNGASIFREYRSEKLASSGRKEIDERGKKTKIS